MLSQEQAKNHPSSNIITRAIGVLPEIEQILLRSDVYRSAVQLLNLCLERPARDNISFIIGHVKSAGSDTVESEETLCEPI